jgi:protoporphyrinogen oxidase
VWCEVVGSHGFAPGVARLFSTLAKPAFSVPDAFEEGDLSLEPYERVIIVGAGPAGLTAGYELAKNRYKVQVLEADPQYVGGIARTVRYKAFRFDIGGHRFFSKNSEIEALWTEFMGDRMRTCSRMSRIYYRGRYFKYPLEPFDALRHLGPIEAIRCILSYLRERRLPPEHIRSFEDWVVSAYGRRLFEVFFKTYTEKVWGVPCSEISADWAAQRIRGLSLSTLLLSLLRRTNHNVTVIKTLVDHFRYPACGPGEMWENVAGMIERRGGAVSTGQRVVEINRAHGRVVSVTTQTDHDCRTHYADHFISTMPLAQLISSTNPSAPIEVLGRARGLRYRDFIMVAVVIDEANMFPDNWIYVHDPGVKVGRIQNFKNWSAEMVPDPRFTVLGMEYFCTENDGMWSASDAQLIEEAKAELAILGLADKSKVVDGSVVRQPKAYPLYDHEYRTNVAHIANFLERETPNLQIAGRNGMHKYNNQDHAMMTGLMAARNIMGGSFDLWRVNSDAEYQESDEASTIESGRMVPVNINLSRSAVG